MFQLSDEKQEGVLRLAERLHEAAIGETITHRDLRQIAGRALAGQYYGIVRAARTKLNREHGIVFVAEKGTGYRRLGSAEGVAASGDIGLKRVRTTTKRYGAQLEHAMHHGNNLTAGERRTAHQTMATFGLINYLARKKTVAQVAVDEETKPDGLSGLRKIFGL
jgi:hypothetical protein